MFIENIFNLDSLDTFIVDSVLKLVLMVLLNTECHQSINDRPEFFFRILMKFSEDVTSESINSFPEIHFILITFNFSVFHGYSGKMVNWKTLINCEIDLRIFSNNSLKYPGISRRLAVIDENTQKVTDFIYEFLVSFPTGR